MFRLKCHGCSSLPYIEDTSSQQIFWSLGFSDILLPLLRYSLSSCTADVSYCIHPTVSSSFHFGQLWISAKRSFFEEQSVGARISVKMTLEILLVCKSSRSTFPSRSQVLSHHWLAYITRHEFLPIESAFSPAGLPLITPEICASLVSLWVSSHAGYCGS